MQHDSSHKLANAYACDEPIAEPASAATRPKQAHAQLESQLSIKDTIARVYVQSDIARISEGLWDGRRSLLRLAALGLVMVALVAACNFWTSTATIEAAKEFTVRDGIVMGASGQPQPVRVSHLREQVSVATLLQWAQQHPQYTVDILMALKGVESVVADAPDGSGRLTLYKCFRTVSLADDAAQATFEACNGHAITFDVDGQQWASQTRSGSFGAPGPLLQAPAKRVMMRPPHGIPIHTAGLSAIISGGAVSM